jgi:hypothetical protein
VTDQRRRQYVPLTSQAGHDRFSSRIKAKFERDGLLVWMLYLAACKRGTTQGEFVYVSESDGWEKLGLLGDEPEFSLRTFFTYTGQLHSTARRASGEVTTIVCRHWDEWNTEFRRQQDASQKAWKRAENTATTQRQSGDEAPTLRRTEGEYEGERKEPPPSTRKEPPARSGPARPGHPLCCNAPPPERPCRSLTFRTEQQLREHYDVVHWLDTDTINALLGTTSTPAPAQLSDALTASLTPADAA